MFWFINGRYITKYIILYQIPPIELWFPTYCWLNLTRNIISLKYVFKLMFWLNGLISILCMMGHRLITLVYNQLCQEFCKICIKCIQRMQRETLMHSWDIVTVDVLTVVVVVTSSVTTFSVSTTEMYPRRLAIAKAVLPFCKDTVMYNFLQISTRADDLMILNI